MPDEIVLTPETENSGTVVADQVIDADAKPADVVADASKEVVPDWAADWREKMAGGDEKELKRLSRFNSPVDVYKSARELERKMSAGEVKSKLPENATPEQLTAYRKDNGIPEKSDGYLESLPDGLVIGADDKPLISAYLEQVHGKNASPAVVAATLDWYYKTQETQIAELATADKAFRQSAEDTLRGEWGGEYRSNVNSIKAFLSEAGSSGDVPFNDLLMNARLADGQLLGSHPDALRWLARLANDANPSGFVSPAAGGSQADSIETEMTAIETKMRTDRRAYDKDEKMQARYRDLITAKERLASR